jgi:hypothetical protein
MSTTAAMSPQKHAVPQWGMFFHEEAHVDLTTPFKREMATDGGATAIDEAEAVATTATPAPPAAAAVPQWTMFFHAAAPQFWTAHGNTAQSVAPQTPQKRAMATMAATPFAAAGGTPDMVQSTWYEERGIPKPAERDEFPMHFAHACASTSSDAAGAGAEAEAGAGAAVVADPVTSATLHEQTEWAEYWHDPSWHPANTTANTTASTSPSPSLLSTPSSAMQPNSKHAFASGIRLPPLQTPASAAEAATLTLSSSASVVLLGMLAGGSGSLLGVASAAPIF